MPRDAKFKFANYDGGLPSHPKPEPSGTLALTANGRWELHYAGGFGRRDRWIYGGIQRYPFTITETSPSSCHVTMHDTQNPEVAASFDLPDTSVAALEEALAGQVRTVAATSELRAKIQSGSWWLASDAFRGLGLTGRFSAGETRYLGGWSGYAKTHTANTNNYVNLDKNGISYKAFKTLFTIPWEQVVDLHVEGPESAAKRVTVGRALALGVFALAAKKTEKSAILVVQLRSGEEAIFDTRKFTAGELRGKLAPITSHLRRANAPSSLTPPEATSPPSAAPSSNGPPTAAAVSVADELKKLAELKDAGLLTEEEFAGQKAKLLDH